MILSPSTFFRQKPSPRQRIPLALLAGLLAATALPPLYLIPLLYLAFAILGLLAFTPHSPRRAFLEGLSFGLGYFILSMYWITSSLLIQPEMHGWLAPLAVPAIAAILALAIALPMAATAIMPGSISRFFTLLILLAFGEWLRGALFQFPWNNFSQSFGFANAMLQPLAVLGRDSYSLLVLTTLLLVPLAIQLRQRRLFAAAAAIPIVFACWGVLRLDQAPNPQQNSWLNAGVRLVQPNISQADKLNPQQARNNLTKLLALSLNDLPGWVKHIIWPEVALHFDIEAYPQLQNDLASLLPVGGVLITGTLRKEQEHYRNSVVAIDHHGSRRLLHDKVKLVPFGEFQPLPFLNSIAGVRGSDFTPGQALSNQTVGLLPTFSTLICYESIFSAEVKPPGHETQWLLNLTNDAWFGNTAGPYQHLAISRWRAIEEGLPLVRVANTGISAVFDAYGRLLSEHPLGTAGIIDIRIPKPLGASTFFQRYPNLIWRLLLTTALFILLFSWFREIRPRQRPEL